jgi:hypothetical protein
MADLRHRPHAAALDRLVDCATLLHADQRPTTSEIAADLVTCTSLARRRLSTVEDAA